MRLFLLNRSEDPSGVSGTGNIAEGIEFWDGTVALRWRTSTASTSLYSSIDDVQEIHGHGGLTKVVYV